MLVRIQADRGALEALILVPLRVGAGRGVAGAVDQLDVHLALLAIHQDPALAGEEDRRVVGSRGVGEKHVAPAAAGRRSLT